MLSKNKLKYIQSLKQKKFRQKYNKFIVEGDKMAKEILINKVITIDSVFATPSWLKMNEKAIKLPLNKTITVSERELKQMSNLKAPNQVLIVADQLGLDWDPKQVNESLSLYLDEIQDPGNLGTILRIADWFGIPNIFLSKGCAELYNPKVVQSTMGAFLRVNSLQVDVVGNESKGISPAVQKQLTARIAIPAGSSTGAESLNAAVATGIICAMFKHLN